MSIRIMTQVWSTDMDHTKKIVLLALADNANDEGLCYPSITTITKKCGLSERTVHSVVKSLEEEGHLRRTLREGRSTIYHITPANVAPPQTSHPAAAAPPPPQSTAKTPANVAPITSKKPSSEPSVVLHQSLPKEEWEEWIDWRREKRYPITGRTIKMQLKILAQYSTAEQRQMIETSINAGWQGIFPPKGGKASAPQQKIGWLEERDLFVGPRGRIYDIAKQQGKSFGSQQEFDDYATEVLRKVRA